MITIHILLLFIIWLINDLNCCFRYHHSTCVEPLPELHFISLSDDGCTPWAGTLWGINSTWPLNCHAIYCRARVFVDHNLSFMIQINYRDFLQSPLQVIHSFSWVQFTLNLFFCWSLVVTRGYWVHHPDKGASKSKSVFWVRINKAHLFK
jgi:hypothetical protein